VFVGDWVSQQGPNGFIITWGHCVDDFSMTVAPEAARFGLQTLDKLAARQN